MKTATLFCLISFLAVLSVNAAAPINFKNIASTNVVKTNDLLLIDSDLGGGSYATRTIPLKLALDKGIWDNTSGVIAPNGGQTTNVLRFTSGLADNATNVAAIIDTAVPWADSGTLQSWKNSWTNVAWITAPSGGIYTGRDADFFWDTTADDNMLTMVRHDTVGDLPDGFVQIAAISGTGTNRTDVVQLQSFIASDAIFDQQWGIGINGGFFIGQPEYFQMSVEGDTFSDIRFVTGIFGPDTQPLYIRPNYGGKTESINVAYKFGTSQAVTNNYIAEFLNAGTNMVSVDWEGALTTGGNTNRWIFKGLSVDGGTTNAHCSVNGTNFFWELKPE